MMAGQPRRARVPVEVAIEFADLPRAVGHPERRAPADRPIATPDPIARLENGDMVAGLAELVRRRQARDPGAENDHFRSMGGGLLERQRFGYGRRADEAHRLHGEVGRAVSSGTRDLPQEVPTRAAHPGLPSHGW